MAIEFKDGDYHVGLFYIDLPKGHPFEKHGGNYLGHLFHDQTKPADRWSLIYRIRHFRDERVFDSVDTRSWYGVEFDALSAEHAEEKISQMMNIIATAAGTTADFLPLRSDREDDCFDKMRNSGKGWLHCRFEHDGITE